MLVCKTITELVHTIKIGMRLTLRKFMLTSAVRDVRDYKINYGELLLRLLWPWGTSLTTPSPPQTSNRLRFRCTATGYSASTCLYKNGYVRLYFTFIWQRQWFIWQWFPSLVLILHLPELRFASQLLSEPPVIPTTKQNNTDKKLDFSTGSVFVQCDKSENTKKQSFQF